MEYYFNLFDADENDPEDYPKVHFLVYRDLDTGDEDKDYLITINKEHEMVYAMQLYSSDWKREHNSRGTWKMNFSAALGNKFNDIDIGDLDPLNPSLKIDPNLRTPVEELECQENEFSEGFELYTCFDAKVNELVFKVELQNNSWLGIGFGSTMTNTDMITWFVEEGVGEVQDLFSKSHSPPREDEL